MAFSDLGINTAELLEFCREVESQKPPQNIPKYPVPKKSTHVNLSTTTCASTNKRVLQSSRSSTGSSEEEEDEEGHIPSYLPPLPSKKESEKGTATALYGIIKTKCVITTKGVTLHSFSRMCDISAVHTSKLLINSALIKAYVTHTHTVQHT